MRKLIILSALGAIVFTGAAYAQEGDVPSPEGKFGGPRHGSMMSRLDKDGDGVISKSEFEAAADQRFSKMDENGDGVLTQDEMQAQRQKMMERFKERMKERRQNGDGPGMGGGFRGREGMGEGTGRPERGPPPGADE